MGPVVKVDAPMTRTLSLWLGCCGAVWSAGVLAQTPAVCEPQTPPRSLSDLLQNDWSHCQHHADWLAYLGERLNAQGRYVEAAEHLERALLLQPTHLAATFAYSVALAGSGDLASAVQLLAQLSTRPDVPLAQRRQLIAAQLRMADEPLSAVVSHAQPALGWLTRSSVGWRVGHDNNLLGVPKLDSLTLTLPSGDLSLPVNDSGQPRAGWYQRTDGRFEASHHTHSQRRTDVAVVLQDRRNPTAPEANAQQFETLVETLPTSRGAWGNLSLAKLHTRGGTRYQSTSMGFGWAWATDGCQSRWGAELQDRRLSSNPVLSGRYSGLIWTWACAPAPTTGASSSFVAPRVTDTFAPVQWLWSVRVGADTPYNPERPGGPQHTVAVRTSVRWTQWLFETEVTHQQDRTGYSPLLDNNRIRHSTRALWRVEHQQALSHGSSGLHLTIGVEGQMQRANLRLFDVRNRNAYLHLRYQW